MSGEFFLAGKEIGGGKYAYDTGVALFGGSEDVVEVARKFFEGFDEFGVLVGLAGERIDFFFFFDGVLEIGAQVVQLVVRFGKRFGFGDAHVAHVAELEADGVDVALDADEEEGIVAVEIDCVGLEAAEAVELKEGIGGEPGHGGQGDEQPQQETEGG